MTVESQKKCKHLRVNDLSKRLFYNLILYNKQQDCILQNINSSINCDIWGSYEGEWKISFLLGCYL